MLLILILSDIYNSPFHVFSTVGNLSERIEKDNNFIKDSLLLNKINSVANSIIKASDLRQQFECKILKTDLVNAYALQDGQIYITMGLINLLDSLKNEENIAMLASAIAHEIAHIVLKHGFEMVKLENLFKKNPNKFDEDITYLINQYSREQEFQADEYAVLYLIRAGYEFESIVKFFKKLRETLGEVYPGDEKFSNHPRLTERIARLYEVRAQIERDFDQWNFGIEAFNEGRYNDAIRHFQNFTKTFSNSAWGWTNLGSAYLFKALSNIENIHVIFSVTYYNEPKERLRGKPEELVYAEEAFRRAIEIDSSYNLVYYGNMGIIYSLYGDYDKAINYTMKAIEGKEELHYFYNNLGNIYYLKKDYDNAIKAYKKSAEEFENWVIPYYNLAILYETTGNNNLAIESWKKLVNVSGFQEEALKRIAKLDKNFKEKRRETKPERTLAGFTIDMREEKVVKKAGNLIKKLLDKKNKIIDDKEKNITIFIKNGRISAILANERCREKTSKGIGIGSKMEDLINAYGLPDDIKYDKDKQKWLYGSYGIIFIIVDGVIKEFCITKNLKLNI